MSVTPEDIANQAIAILDEAPITSLDDDDKVARLLNLHFDLTVEAELQKHAWVFAITSDEVVGTDLDTGAGTLNWSYDIPADALRILPLTYNGEPDGVPISWRREGDKILTDQPSPRIIRYIANLTDPNDWDAVFTEVLVAALAVKIALPLTHKTGMLQVAQTAYDRALEAAHRANAIQRGGKYFDRAWAQHRGDNRYWRA